MPGRQEAAISAQYCLVRERKEVRAIGVCCASSPTWSSSTKDWRQPKWFDDSDPPSLM